MPRRVRRRPTLQALLAIGLVAFALVHFLLIHLEDGAVPGRIIVHVVPHSHVDPGWPHTAEQYYDESVRVILCSAVRSLNRDAAPRPVSTTAAPLIAAAIFQRRVDAWACCECIGSSRPS